MAAHSLTTTPIPTPSSAQPSADPQRAFLEHRASVYRWARVMGCPPDQALDVVQEVFLRLLRAGDERPSAIAVGSWLRQVTANLVVDRWKSTRSREAREAASAKSRSGTAARADASRDDRSESIREAMADLSEQQHLVLSCKIVDGMTFAQIARELQLTIPTVKTHYLRALESMRDAIADGRTEVSHEL